LFHLGDWADKKNNFKAKANQKRGGRFITGPSFISNYQGITVAKVMNVSFSIHALKMRILVAAFPQEAQVFWDRICSPKSVLLGRPAPAGLVPG
jgi:hypothetical protein